MKITALLRKKMKLRIPGFRTVVRRLPTKDELIYQEAQMVEYAYGFY